MAFIAHSHLLVKQARPGASAVLGSLCPACIMAEQGFHEWAEPPLAASGASAVLWPRPHDGVWVAPVPWLQGSWVRHRPTGHWGYVFRSECNMCYVHFPVHIALVPEWLRMAAIRLDLSRTA